MKKVITTFLISFLWAITIGQTIDSKFISGKWKLIKHSVIIDGDSSKPEICNLNEVTSYYEFNIDGTYTLHHKDKVLESLNEGKWKLLPSENSISLYQTFHNNSSKGIIKSPGNDHFLLLKTIKDKVFTLYVSEDELFKELHTLYYEKQN